MRYRAYGLTFSSDIVFPELAAAAGRAALRLELARDIDLRGWQRATPRLHDADVAWLTVWRRGGDFRIRFGEGEEFIWSPSARRLTANAGIPRATLRHLVLDQLLPLLLGHDRTVLHASAIGSPRGAIAFLGPTGVGKSTLAASFGRAGWRVIADDALVVRPRGGAALALPAYRGLRLWRDAARRLGAGGRVGPVAAGSNKIRVSGRGTIAFSRRPARLVRLYLLAPGRRRSVAIEPLSARDALMQLVQHSYVLDALDAGRLVAHLDRLVRECLPLGVRRLAYPRDLAALPAVRAAVVADLRGAFRR